VTLVLFTLAGVLLSAGGLAGIVGSVAMLRDGDGALAVGFAAGLAAVVGPLCICVANGWIS